VGLGNFSWDWIYAPYLEGDPDRAWLVDAMRRSYARADLLLRMPLHGPMDAFREIEEIPHVVRPRGRSREQIRRDLGIEAERRPVVVVSFGGFAAVQFDRPLRLDPGPFRFVTFGDGLEGLPEDTVRLPVDHGHSHEDLVAAADALITKPGYGTIAECLAARTPFLYTSRDDFREYDVLVRGIRKGARAAFLPRTDLLGLRWRSHLERLLSGGGDWDEVATDGARVAAGRLLEMRRP
jgi:L-arabinokinase